MKGDRRTASRICVSVPRVGGYWQRGKFVRDFVAAWDKVMNLDRFDRALIIGSPSDAQRRAARRGRYRPGSSVPAKFFSHGRA